VNIGETADLLQALLNFVASLEDHPDVGRHHSKSEQDSGSEDEHDQCLAAPAGGPESFGTAPQKPGCAQGLAEAPIWLLGTYRDGS